MIIRDKIIPPDHCKAEHPRSHEMRQDTVIVADLFCGAGGLSVGLSDAGLAVAVGVDNNGAAIATARANLPHDIRQHDLSDVDGAIRLLRPYSATVLAGGPPCQDFSSSGARKEGKRADLSHAYIRIGISLRCRYILMENVERALSSTVYQAALNRLRASGYGLSVFVLDASFYGVPQIRKRAVVFAKLGAGDHWLAKPEPVSSKQMTVRDYFGDQIEVDHYYRHPRSYHRRAVFSVDEPSPTIRGVNRPVPANHKPHRGDTADIRTVRTLTTTERAGLQTFPKGFRWVGSRTSVEQMIGNAVPCALGKVLGHAIMADVLRGRNVFANARAA
jgi:DNA (cytosine-5)-methyltransferase 1